MNYVLGIDPGFDGGVALLEVTSQERYAYAIPMPISVEKKEARRKGKKIIRKLKEVLIPELVEWLKHKVPGLRVDLAVVEQEQAYHGQGIVSTGKFLHGYGKLLGMLDALGIRRVLVPPKAWQKLVLGKSTSDKQRAIMFARNTFLNINLVLPRKRKPHDGMADALCLAELGRQAMWDFHEYQVSPEKGRWDGRSFKHPADLLQEFTLQRGRYGDPGDG